jgi:hypothetical protein
VPQAFPGIYIGPGEKGAAAEKEKREPQAFAGIYIGPGEEGEPVRKTK